MKEFQARAQRMARKPHVCDICGNGIRPGGEYIATSTFVDGRYRQGHRHIHCDAVFYAYEQDTGIEPKEAGPVLDWLREIGCDDCPARLKCENPIGWDETKAFSCRYALVNALMGRFDSSVKRSLEFMEGGEQP